MNVQSFKLGEDWLTAGKAMHIVNGNLSTVLSETTEHKITKSWKIVQNIVDKGHPVYGINTGFGRLFGYRIKNLK